MQKDFEQRVTKRFPEYFKIAKLMEKDGLSAQKACDQVGVPVHRFYSWRSQSPDFKPVNKGVKRTTNHNPIDIPAAPRVDQKARFAVIVGDATEVGNFVRSFLQ